MQFVSLPENPNLVLDDSGLTQSVTALFRERQYDSSLEHIGSGVFLDTEDDVFLLTAAHVMDESDKTGSLFAGCGNTIQAVSGYYMCGLPPDGGTRKDDVYDVGYVRLSGEWAARVRAEGNPLRLDNVNLQSRPLFTQHVTFCGFPWRATKQSGESQETDLSTYTGHVVSNEIYQKLSLDTTLNIAARIRRKRMQSTRHGGRQRARMPHGISGGLIIEWPINPEQRALKTKLRATGITNMFDKDSCVIAGTAMFAYLTAIERNS